MPILCLTREVHTLHCCRGRLEVFDDLNTLAAVFYTIEKPWVPHEEGGKGGMPFRSCIPWGSYRIEPFVRPNGDRAWIVFNPTLDVYKLDTDIPQSRRGMARYLILIHVGNFVSDVVGCIAPGLGWSMNADGSMMVVRSREAMDRLHGLLDGREAVKLEVL